MSKLKTSASISKRFKITATGKLLRHKANHNHLLQKKTSNLKRRLSQIVRANQCDTKNLKVKLSH